MNEAVEPVQKVVVLGAGMMGAGIAYVCASAGIQVALKDVDLARAEEGKQHGARIAAGEVARGQRTPDSATALLDRITPIADPRDAIGADCVIEAVDEDAATKARVISEIEPHLAADAMLASNTSTLSITALAAGVTRPQAFLGMHFASPVHRMPLIEVVRGDQTSPVTIARARALATRLDKIPIVVRDARGFFISRVMIAYLNEGLTMLSEGVPALALEQACTAAGYPVPVLQLCDELNMHLMQRIRDANRDAAVADGQTWQPLGAEVVFDRMAGPLNRPGRREGRGFYDYADGRREELWPGLSEAFGTSETTLPAGDLRDRLLFAQVLEAQRSFDEGVIDSTDDANLASILGIGFPSSTGGVFGYLDGYRGSLPEAGPTAFVVRAEELAARYGQRFQPTDSLRARRSGVDAAEPATAE